jgi:hypothetical protein
MHYIADDLDMDAWVNAGLARLERYRAHAVGVFCLFAFIVAAFPAALPPDLLPAAYREPHRSGNESR